jgi:TatA/E family protein of Tat protein translocase
MVISASGRRGGSEYLTDHYLVDRVKESHMLADVFGVDGIIVLIVVVVLLFGGAAIPKLARNLGSAKNEFEKGLDEGKKTSASLPVIPTASDPVPPVMTQSHVTTPDHANPGS